MTTRMLLSHNFNVDPNVVPALSREEFCAVFQQHLPESCTCRLLEHPHWIVEVLFASDSLTPAQVGEHCAQALRTQRQGAGVSGLPTVLALGGLKTTPATSASPDALQTGEWGVDVVETENSEMFLQGIGWAVISGQKPADQVFKAEIS